jgi:hypothetical protein
MAKRTVMLPPEMLNTIMESAGTSSARPRSRAKLCSNWGPSSAGSMSTLNVRSEMTGSGGMSGSQFGVSPQYGVAPQTAHGGSVSHMSPIHRCAGLAGLTGAQSQLYDSPAATQSPLMQACPLQGDGRGGAGGAGCGAGAGAGAGASSSPLNATTSPIITSTKARAPPTIN